jgi:hypothetical protein
MVEKIGKRRIRILLIPARRKGGASKISSDFVAT